uniref:C2H2-type domain-containing protein n=1 Tax=Trichuris muris TaxID=70415 RepID=A0A5S6Q3N8_TRIMR
MAITAANRSELGVDHLAEDDCEDRLVIDVAPTVSGAVQDPPAALVADLADSNLSAVASRFYSQYALAQQQYIAALARVAGDPYASALGCSYFTAGSQMVPSTMSMAAASPTLLSKIYASPFTIMAQFPSTAAPNLKCDDKVTSSPAVDQTKQPLGATLSSSSSGGESWCGMSSSSSISASCSSEEGPTANNGATSVIRRSSNATVNPKAVEEHITRLISENEALLEPSSVLLKRRSYTRQQYGSLDHSTGQSSSGRRQSSTAAATVKSTRSQSLVDLGMLASFKPLRQDGSRKMSEQPSADVGHYSCHKCAYCKIGFRNMDGVRAHEIRCAQRTEVPTCSHGGESTAPKSSSSASPLVAEPSSAVLLNRSVGEIDEQVTGTSKSHRMYPYCNTVNVPRLLDLEPLRTSQAQALIAQTTFCTVRRRPVSHRRMLESGESVWANWMPKVSATGTKIVRNRRDSHLNILLMGCYRLRQKQSPLSYTIATKQMANLRVTHSSYWRLCKNRSSAASSICQQQMLKGGEPVKTELAAGPSSLLTAADDCCPTKLAATSALALSNAAAAPAEGTAKECNELADSYVRGRGFGRYVCDRCGIRCKKPSMLKKHLRCHLDVRPYSCRQCAFSFKTKGNLTKHLKSKSHRKCCKRCQVEHTSTSKGECSVGISSPLTTAVEDAADDDEFPEQTEEGLDEEGEEDDDDDDDDDVEEDDDDDDDAEEISDATTGSATEQESIVGGHSGTSASTLQCVSPGASPEVSSPSVVVCSAGDVVKQSLKRCECAPIATQPLACATAASSVGAKSCTLQHPIAMSSSSVVDNAGAASIHSVLGPLDEISMPSEAAQRDIDRYIANSNNEAKPVCATCGKQFTKFALLRLHMSVHCLEQSSRRYEIKCPECSSSFRSRSLLKKHLACAHSDLCPLSDEIASGHEPQQTRSSGQLNDAFDPQEASVSQKPACNPRPFVCTDCDVAFRIHGHLAKHLRSKLHIMKLESVGKLPIGTFARIEEAGVHFFQEIDTRSGENSLRSLLDLMERFVRTDMPEQKSDDAVDQMAEDDLADLTDSDELVIDVEGGCSPDDAGKSAISDNNSSTSAIGSKDSSSQLDRSRENVEIDSTSHLSQGDGLHNGDFNLGNVIRLPGRSVVAGVWVPPTSDEFRDSFVFGKCQSSDSLPVRTTPTTISNGVEADVAKQMNGGATLNVADFAIDAKLIGSPTENQNASKNFCQWCDLTYPTWIELMVHRLSDHIVMKDGRDFRCPLANCDRVYPNRDCLRQHLVLHFLGRIKDCIADPAYEVPRSSSGYELCSDDFSSSPARIGRRSSPSAQSKRAKTCRREKADNNSCPERNGCISYSSTSDSEASHLSISNNSPVTSPPEAISQTAKGTPQRRQTTKRHSEQISSSSSSSLLASLLPDVKRTAVASKPADDESPQHRLIESAVIEQQLPVSWLQESKQLRAPTVLRQSPQRGFVSGANWNHVSPLLQDSISSRTLLSATASPAGAMLGSRVADPTMAAMVQTAAVANPAAFMNYQNLCQQLATASILSAMQQQQHQAQCGGAGIGHPLLAALNGGPFNNGRVSAPTVGGVPSSVSLPPPLAATGVGSFIPMALYMCLMCGKQFGNLIEYQEHMVSHSQPRPFLCDVCDAGFTTARALRAHLPCKQQASPSQ